jgi:hypothetical protein
MEISYSQPTKIDTKSVKSSETSSDKNNKDRLYSKAFCELRLNNNPYEALPYVPFDNATLQKINERKAREPFVRYVRDERRRQLELYSTQEKIEKVIYE